MENEIGTVTNLVPALMQNTSLSIRLEGWPAAVTAIAMFGICVVTYMIKTTQPQIVYVSDNSSENEEGIA